MLWNLSNNSMTDITIQARVTRIYFISTITKHNICLSILQPSTLTAGISPSQNTQLPRTTNKHPKCLTFLHTQGYFLGILAVTIHSRSRDIHPQASSSVPIVSVSSPDFRTVAGGGGYTDALSLQNCISQRPPCETVLDT